MRVAITAVPPEPDKVEAVVGCKMPIQGGRLNVTKCCFQVLVSDTSCSSSDIQVPAVSSSGVTLSRHLNCEAHGFPTGSALRR